MQYNLNPIQYNTIQERERAASTAVSNYAARANLPLHQEFHLYVLNIFVVKYFSEYFSSEMMQITRHFFSEGLCTACPSV